MRKSAAWDVAAVCESGVVPARGRKAEAKYHADRMFDACGRGLWAKAGGPEV